MEDVVVVRGEAELFERAAHLFEATTEELACAANSLFTWVSEHRANRSGRRPRKLRKLFRLSAVLDAAWAEQARQMLAHGAQVRVCAHDLNETILLDGRVAIVAGDTSHGLRDFTVITRPELVHGVNSLFEAAWRGATDLAVHEAAMTELRPVVPAVLGALNDGLTDEAAARALGMSLRTYRRRVADLMAALGASSRFQAGARARELGLV